MLCAPRGLRLEQFSFIVSDTRGHFFRNSFIANISTSTSITLPMKKAICFTKKVVRDKRVFAELYFYRHAVFDKIRLVIRINRTLASILNTLFLFVGR